MKLAPWLLVLLIGCSGAGDDSYPIEPGGGGGGGNNGGGGSGSGDDGGVDAPGATFAGRVCVLEDSRSFASCAPTVASGTVVRAGTYAATADATGNFTIAKPATGAVFTIEPGNGADPLVRALVPYDPSVAQLPVLTAARYEDILAASTIVPSAGRAAIFVRFTDGTDSLADVTVASAATLLPTRYDGAQPDEWTPTAATTSANGVAWLAEVDVPPTSGTVTVTASRVVMGVAETRMYNVPVAADRVTFATYTF